MSVRIGISVFAVIVASVLILVLSESSKTSQTPLAEKIALAVRAGDPLRHDFPARRSFLLVAEKEDRVLVLASRKDQSAMNLNHHSIDDQQFIRGADRTRLWSRWTGFIPLDPTKDGTRVVAEAPSIGIIDHGNIGAAHYTMARVPTESGATAKPIARYGGMTSTASSHAFPQMRAKQRLLDLLHYKNDGLKAQMLSSVFESENALHEWVKDLIKLTPGWDDCFWGFRTRHFVDAKESHRLEAEEPTCPTQVIPPLHDGESVIAVFPQGGSARLRVVVPESLDRMVTCVQWGPHGPAYYQHKLAIASGEVSFQVMTDFDQFAVLLGLARREGGVVIHHEAVWISKGDQAPRATISERSTIRHEFQVTSADRLPSERIFVIGDVWTPHSVVMPFAFLVPSGGSNFSISAQEGFVLNVGAIVVDEDLIVRGLSPRRRLAAGTKNTTTELAITWK